VSELSIGRDRFVDRHSEGADLAGQVKAKPARQAGGEHRDDHLVKAHEVQRILDGGERLVGADTPVTPLPAAALSSGSAFAVTVSAARAP
jgi:hypothetical protein